MSWEQWRNEATKAAWNGALDTIERDATEFARSRRLETSLTRCHHDSPDVTMKWADGSSLRNLQIVLAGETYPMPVRFLGHVWRDSGPDDREFRAIDFGTVEYPTPDALSERFATDLASAFDQSSGLSLSHTVGGD
jgi:hypothetical protein